MNKKAQFYLITIIILIALFIGLATMNNYAKKVKITSLEDAQSEINIEKRNVLDYISNQELDEVDTKTKLTNFSNEFINKIGLDKDLLFVFGTKENITLVGNKLEETALAYNVTGSFENITGTEYEFDLDPTINPIEFQLDSEIYQFELEEGQNIYYLIKHEYNGETHIIHG